MTANTRNKQEIYDAAATAWWSDELRWVRTLKNLVPARLKFFDRHFDWAGKRVLDLGCAGGFMAEAMAQRGAQVTGIDPAKEAIAAARSHAAQSGLDIRYDTGMGEALPYDDAAFDAVVCVDVLEHVSDLEQVLQGVARVLKPGGLFFYDTINRNVVARLATITVAEDLLGLLPKGTHDPAMYIKPGELEDGLRQAGLTPGKMAGLGPTGLNRKLDFTFGVLPFRQVIYIGTARKPEKVT
ncbi:Ubiquinone biosynthesis O-methyltransferase [Roseovarius sp. THAF27]|uniref:bifunctional 2-polyprenyl-6-hydroxyphenol methylase/3-demethylubiquinol 3-O-methyltransferase UbiG n=1 Tax=Roseovarius sp. THAF27 TaxID=2587850 RepID=UPI0012687EA4|nr:bifunctional 2-polyprenyl-6-hydroxyphenol methylase/3-demethylubiquinol 3-O-methyltransferase UbiG [Roseovarius sp. THAF27]QFT79123.1 Ubiquinone biosynthesis O-methyltransferase [Roseovarius sp. THAF27]